MNQEERAYGLFTLIVAAVTVKVALGIVEIRLGVLGRIGNLGFWQHSEHCMGCRRTPPRPTRPRESNATVRSGDFSL